MSGHNKWSSIKHKKAKEDAKRGKVFTKIIREIIVAARDGGGDTEMNPALRNAVNKATSENMPKDNIERAIKKGTGELEGINYEHIMYEGYAPGGVAMLIEAVTDNRRRSVAEIRHILTKHNGSLAEKGSVSWNFTQSGTILVIKEEYNEDELMMIALDAGAEDFSEEDEFFIITTNSKNLYNVVHGLEQQDIKIEKADLEYVPQNTVPANDNASQVIKLIEALEELDDVQNVYANFQIDDEILEQVAGE